MDPSTVAAAVAGAGAVGAYLNARLHLSQDINRVLRERRALKLVSKALENGQISGYYPFAEAAKTYPDTVCLWSREGVYTYAEAHERVCQWGHYFLSLGVQRGDFVALYLLNSPEFAMAWLGLWSIGCAPALINAGLGGKVLLHCLKLGGAKYLLFDSDANCTGAVNDAREPIEKELNITPICLDKDLKDYVYRAFPTTPPSDSLRRGLDPSSPCGLLYTSGTTGMPKALGLTRQRIYMTAMLQVTSDKPGPSGDRWYNCMPFYHGTGGVCLMTAMLNGVGMAMGKKFSVSRFWRDVVDSESTFIVYVGETARYLLTAPPSELDRAHKVRCAWGNGMRPDIWEKFRSRFGIAEISEFFNSTEGMLVLDNPNKGPFTANCVGHDGAWARRQKQNVTVPVAIDPVTGDIWRDPVTGFAKRTPYSQGGEILIRVPNEKAFVGYWKNPDATSKKFVYNVFKKGDIYYRSGDALRRDDDGRWFFLDRLGDTFRWKSENVSTAEVAAVLGAFPGVLETVVYGVQVPGYEGKAGCAAVLLDQPERGQFDFAGLLQYAKKNLPKYAVPVFLRILSPAENNSMHTSNNKQNKLPLKEEGIDPSKLGTKIKLGDHDRMLWLTPGADNYVDFDEKAWEKLNKGQVRL